MLRLSLLVVGGFFLGIAGQACTLSNNGDGTLQSTCPVRVTSSAGGACSEPFDFLGYGSVWDTMCSGMRYGQVDVPSGEFNRPDCTIMLGGSDDEFSCTHANGTAFNVRAFQSPPYYWKGECTANQAGCPTTSTLPYHCNPWSPGTPPPGAAPCPNATGCTYTCVGMRDNYTWFEEERR